MDGLFIYSQRLVSAYNLCTLLSVTLRATLQRKVVQKNNTQGKLQFTQFQSLSLV